MASLSVTIKSPERNEQKVLIEMDADRFERLAADLNLFNRDFLESIVRAEKDSRTGKVYKLKSLKELKK